MQKNDNAPMDAVAKRLLTSQEVTQFCQVVKAGPGIAGILEEALPCRTKDQQKALVAVATWRLAGAALPASIELIKRMPMFTGMHPESIQAAFMQLADASVLEFRPYGEDGSEGAFTWPQLEAVIAASMKEAAGPTVIMPGA